MSYQKFDEEFVTRRLEQHKLMLDRRSTLAALLLEKQFMERDLEVETYQPKVGRPPLRKLSALARKVMANAARPISRKVSRDSKGRIIAGVKVKGAAA